MGCTYYINIVKSLMSIYSNPIFRKIKGKHSAVSILRFGGMNPDKVIYFITDVSTSGSGIFSIYKDILAEMSFAKSMGWTPIIDDTPQLLRRTKVSFRKNRNMMSEYFEFNNQVTVSSVLKSQKVIVGRTVDDSIYRNISLKDKYKFTRRVNFFECDETELAYWRRFAKYNLKYKDSIQNSIDEAYVGVIGNRADVLGVAIREGKMGMSCQGISVSGETRQPSIQEIIQITQKRLMEWKCNFIYLSCESNKAIEIFIQHFGKEKILYLDRIRLDYDYLVSVKSMKEGVKRGSKYPKLLNNYKQIDLDYIKDMYILSKCDCCILPMNCGTEVAFMKNENLRNYHIIK